jgi:hypothetical protein
MAKGQAMQKLKTTNNNIAKHDRKKTSFMGIKRREIVSKMP